MVKCKNCGNINAAYEMFCPECSAEYELSDVDSAALLSEAKKCAEKRDFIGAVDIYRFLASLGHAEAEVEFASMLEKGALVPRDLDMAMSYFYSAARSGDAYAAYRYSRLISRINESAGGFWLAYSAICGCKDSYVDAYSYYSAEGDEESASYYCALVALEGDSDCIVEMAKRHLHGIGVIQNEGIAKWYIQRLGTTPLFALKLRNRLIQYGVTVKPPKPVLKNRDKILRSLISEAKRMELRPLVKKLAEEFAKSEAADASVSLAGLYIEGIDLERDVEKGISLLTEAMNAGSAMGAKCLGDLFAIGKQVERDIPRAIDYYRRAAALGSDGAYEALGDIFSDGMLTDPEMKFALSIYEKGAAEGDERCAEKAETIKRQRERDYQSAVKLEEKSSEEAFGLYKKSLDAGFLPAHAKIGKYYEYGIAAKKDRRAAFNHYKAAVDSGDESALYDLGRCYSRGIGTAFNFKLASEILSLARERGVTEADEELYRIYENKKKHMIRSLYSTAMQILYQGKFDAARELFEVCTKLGSPEATYALGCLYEFGISVESNRRSALLLYKKATERGYKDKNQTKKQKILKISKKLTV